MALDIEQIKAKVDRLRTLAAPRDARHRDVLAIRKGDLAAVAGDLFPDNWPKSIVANFIDVAARDMAEVIAPLPSFNCSTANVVSDNARKFADKRTKIAHYYIQHSELQRQMLNGADQYNTFAFLPFLVEPDFETACPRIRLISPFGAYPEFDKWGRTVSFSQRLLKPAWQLAGEYPEYANTLLGPDKRDAASNLEVVLYYDADQTVLYLPGKNNLVLAQVQNPLGECPVKVARRPGVDADDWQGQFDDVVWIQIARAKMALLGMEAAEKSVRAPLVVPDDVVEVAFGGDEIIYTRDPKGVSRVGLELPQGAFAESQLLGEEMRQGARYPQSRTGNMDASVITGRGVQELQGGFDAQIKGAQLVIGDTLRQVIGLCFKMDEKYWGGRKKNVRGNANGSPFDIAYTPAKDISGDHTIDVTYGFAAGMDPNRALVFMLQLRGDHAIPRDMLQRHLPFDIDVSQVQQQIDVEEMRDALKQTMAGYAQALPMIAQSGGDPAAIISKMTAVIEDIQKGRPIEKAVADAFAPEPQAPPAAPGPGVPAAAVPGSEPAGGLNPDGTLPGVAAGQAGMGPGGRPDLEQLMAGLNSGGAPSLSSSVLRRIPA